MIGITPPVVGAGGSINGDTFMYGNLIIFKKPTNLNKGMLEAGDGLMGVIEGKMVNWGYYLGGNVQLLVNVDVVTSQDF